MNLFSSSPVALLLPTVLWLFWQQPH